VSGRLLADHLAAAGLDPLEIPAKTRLYDLVLAAFQNLTATRPKHAYWIPGRLEVFGTHTDYAGGHTLVSALPRGFAFAASGRDDGQLRVVDAVAGETLAFETGRLSRSTGWRHYVEVVGERLARNFPGASLGADIVFASDLPRAAGMSSSSGLMVGIASALVRSSGIRTRAEWRRDIAGPLDEAGYYACIENGRTFGALTGDAGVGTHGGSEDHAAMLCGAAGALSAFAFVPMRHIGTIALPDAWGVVVASSGVAAEKTGNALDSYNRLATGASILLELWNRAEAPAGSLAAALTSDDTAADRLRAIVRGASIDGWPREALEARLEHFIREDARVLEAVAAFRDGNASDVGKLAAASQRDAEHTLRNQMDRTVALTRLAVECGAFAARSFGAGFGGSVWAMVIRTHAQETGRRTILIVEDDDDLRRMFRTALTIAGFAVEEAVDGAAALQRIHYDPPHLVVLDLSLPTVSGLLVYQEISAHAHTKHIPVVIVTGSTMNLDHLDVPCVLRKPVNPEKLISTVRQCLQSGSGIVS
jgi:galactokinase